MTYSTPKDVRLAPMQAARTAAGRFKVTPVGPRPDRADDLRRVRAAQRTLQSRQDRFAHLRAAHD